MNTVEIMDMTAPSQAYQRYLENGEFRIQRSKNTGKYVFYPRVAVPGSGETDLEWVEASGGGVVYSTTTVRRKADKGGDYNVAIVELAEGPRLMTNVEGIGAEEVYIGMEVVAHIKAADESRGYPLLVFRPAN